MTATSGALPALLAAYSFPTTPARVSNHIHVGVSNLITYMSAHERLWHMAQHIPIAYVNTDMNGMRMHWMYAQGSSTDLPQQVVCFDARLAQTPRLPCISFNFLPSAVSTSEARNAARQLVHTPTLCTLGLHLFVQILCG